MTEPAAPTDAAPFSVLVVCTANRYRSPAGEHLLRRAAAAKGLRWNVYSAGTRAVPGQPMDPRLAEILSGGDAAFGNWRTSRLGPRAGPRADVVLVAAEEHRQLVVTLEPTALPRTFTLRQFARLAE